ncbi:MAG: hypothetical protein ACON5F_14095 [Jejuia sp.]
MKQLFRVLTLAILLSSMVIISCGEKKSKAPIATYTVDAVTNKEYEIEGSGLEKSENPTLTLRRGETYEFVVKAYGHPFYIKTEKVPGKEKAYDEGVTNNGAQDETILVFTVPKNAPDVLYYVCKFHKMMSGELRIVD